MLQTIPEERAEEDGGDSSAATDDVPSAENSNTNNSAGNSSVPLVPVIDAKYMHAISPPPPASRRTADCTRTAASTQFRRRTVNTRVDDDGFVTVDLFTPQ